MRRITHQNEPPPLMNPLLQPLRLDTDPLHEPLRHLQQRPDPRIPALKHPPQLLDIHRPGPVEDLFVRAHGPVHDDVHRAVHQVAQRLTARPKPGMDMGGLDEVADERVLARFRRVDDDAVGEPTDGAGRGRALEERFAADGVFSVGTDQEIPLDGFAAVEDDSRSCEGGVFPGDFYAEMDGGAEGGCFGGEGAAEVGAVDDEVGHAVGFGDVGVEGEGGEDGAGVVGVEFDGGGDDGLGDDFVEEPHFLEDFVVVGGELDACSDLGFMNNGFHYIAW